eukprot:8309316-Lingulodinium_polyedra.AAC.1
MRAVPAIALPLVMLLPCRSPSSPCYCHAIAIIWPCSLPCYCHALATPSPCPCHAIAMLLTRVACLIL